MKLETRACRREREEIGDERSDSKKKTKGKTN